VLGDDIDTLSITDELVERTATGVDHVPDQTVCFRISPVRVDIEQPTEVTILRVERDDEHVESTTGVCDGEVCSQRGLANAPGF
jgi:hypothetical protein